MLMVFDNTVLWRTFGSKYEVWYGRRLEKTLQCLLSFHRQGLDLKPAYS